MLCPAVCLCLVHTSTGWRFRIPFSHVIILRMSQSLTYYIDTMGCQMNERDSETMAGVLQAQGLLPAANAQQARVVILNTCAVREKPEHKVFSKLGELARLKRRRPSLLIGVCGCLAQAMAEQIRRQSPYVDFILGPRNLSALPDIIAAGLAGHTDPVAVTDMAEFPDETQPAARAEGVSAFVNVMYGCNNFCAYCIVPYTRGREISRAVDDIVAEIRQVLAEGYQEVTLLGQNVNSYQGLTATGETCSFGGLLRTVGQIEGLARVRFTTSHPKDLSEDLLHAIANTPAVCEHLHLPLQAGDDAVLERMGRGYTQAHFIALVEQARALIPHLAITTDVMVGFPGETTEQFEHTFAAFETIRFDQAFMFKYSDRPGTRAEKMADKVPESEKQRRLEAIVALQNEIAREVNVAQEGRLFEVLVEGRDVKSPEKWRGRTRQNKLMIFTGENLQRGQRVSVRAWQGHLWGFIGARDEGSSA